MITKNDYEKAVNKALKYYRSANIKLINIEKTKIEVADFGLNDLNNIGIQLITYINTKRVCAKEIVLFPFQTCPEHKHVNNHITQGKEETFRCRKGTVYLYVEGDKTSCIKAKLPDTKLSVFHEIILKEGEQHTIMPNTLHWFQGGEHGAIVSEFSTTSTDETDIFTDERIKRIPEIIEKT